jgi:hypothetical protein
MRLETALLLDILPEEHEGTASKAAKGHEAVKGAVLESGIVG